MVTESTSSNSKDVQDEANPLQRSSRIRKEPNQLMYYQPLIFSGENDMVGSRTCYCQSN